LALLLGGIAFIIVTTNLIGIVMLAAGVLRFPAARGSPR
jgi:hypothetical protein